MPDSNRKTVPFEIRRSAIQGRGAFATRRIRKGERVIEYTGERITNAEADKRYDDDRMRRHHTYLFTLTQRTVVDGGAGGNASRFINHSCEPNCEAVIEDGHIWIRALRTIAKGRELTYDYQYERVGGDDEADERKYPCRCGTRRCRGTILLPKRRRRRRRRPAKRQR
jgi:SET domain-containing protein